MIDPPPPSNLLHQLTGENGVASASEGATIFNPRVSRRRACQTPKRLIDREKAPSMSYASYIRSDAWRLSPARLAEILASGGRCRVCNDGGAATILHVHHRTYERLGCEAHDDLTAVCEPCHDVITAMLRGRATDRRPLPEATDLPKSGNRTLIDSLERKR